MDKLAFRSSALVLTLIAGAAGLAGACGDAFTAGPGGSTASSTSSGSSGTTATGTGGDPGTSSSSGPGGAGGSGGVTGSGGAGGGTTTTGVTTGTGGSGGGTDDCTQTGCDEGKYCREDTKVCQACTDMDRFLFDHATPLPLSPTGSNVFPRVADTGATWRLVFSFFNGTNYDIASSAPPPWTQGAPASANVINTPGAEGGPLLLPPGIGLFGVDPAAGLLVFDTTRNGGAEIFVATAIDGLTAGPMPPPINDGTADQHMALAWAQNPKRAFWVTTRPDPAEQNAVTTRLVTVTLGGAVVVPTNVQIRMPGNCIQSFDDVAPWVTPDGTMLLFHGYSLDPNDCAQKLDDFVHVFYAPLDAQGQIPAGSTALEIEGLNVAKPITPSLSPDACQLYVSSIEDGTLYSAPRR